MIEKVKVKVMLKLGTMRENFNLLKIIYFIGDSFNE